MKRYVLLIGSLAATLLSMFSIAADRGMADEEIWHACWGGDPDKSHRLLNYPSPIRVTIRNRSKETWELCVFDNRCPYTLFRGILRPKHSISLNACADKQRRGSICIMNSDGYIWFYDDTRDRTITLE